jgi:mannose/fructose/N-acetylgalactosamine-specific phosphotransferase system component IIB
MIRFSDDLKKELIQLAAEKEIFLEGNITKIIDTDGHAEFHSYIQSAINRDRENRKKRLEITKTIQEQNKALMEWKSHNEELNKELQLALAESEKAKQLAENDLDVLQKKTQNELVGSIVKVALWIICGVGTITSILFALTLFTGLENKTVESSWSNMFSILLTNSFSIVGTIMGVKYAGNKGSGKCQYCKKN